MKQFKWNLHPLKYKLAKYFLAIVFATIILLWFFQIVFLEGFYKSIKTTQIEQGAKQISVSIRNNSNISDVIDSVSRSNSLSVYIYDTSTEIFKKMYSRDYNNAVWRIDYQEHQAYKYYREAYNSGGTYLGTVTVKTDAMNMEELQRNLYKYTNDSQKDAHNNVNSATAGDYSKYESLVYAEIIQADENTQYFMLINSMITPVSSVVDTLRVQLMIVSAIVIILAIGLSFYASRRISKPLSDMSETAKELAKQNYDIEFKGNGYLEVKELSDTLNYTRRELSKVDELRQELIANISHDLRTPLTMIKGYGEVMRDLPGENTPENVQIIIDEASRLSNLVTDLLDLSKLQSGVLSLDIEVFSLTDSINDIFKRYSKLKEQEGYNIIFDSHQNVFVKADELKISQVIYNLMNNAVNYAGKDKTIIVSQIVKGDTVRIEVTDHGDGIPADKIEYIWDRYYKVDKEHKRAVIGTGLGLSIVKNILDLHHSNYGVISEPEKGSTFWFELEYVKIEETKQLP